MTGPSDSSVRVEALALIRRAAHQLRAWHVKYREHSPDWLPPGGDVRWLEDASDYFDAQDRRAALPVAPLTDERIDEIVMANAIGDHPTARGLARDIERALLAQAAQPLPVVALSDANRELMEQEIDALEELTETIEMGDPHWTDAKCFKAAVAAIAALRTRLLRHSEGKAE